MIGKRIVEEISNKEQGKRQDRMVGRMKGKRIERRSGGKVAEVREEWKR